MVRNVILLALGIVALGVLYLSGGMIETVAAPALTTTASSNASHKLPPPTGIAQKFGNSLMILDGAGKPQSVDAAKLAGVKYWAFYYSASWCPPCRAFTPVLVDFYRGFKPSHPEFELIFVNDDRNESAMLSYMKSDA